MKLDSNHSKKLKMSCCQLDMAPVNATVDHETECYDRQAEEKEKSLVCFFFDSTAFSLLMVTQKKFDKSNQSDG